MFLHDQVIIFNRPFAIMNSYPHFIRYQAREACFQAAKHIAEDMETIRGLMPTGLRTTVNGHIHSLLYAAWVFLYESTLDWPDANVEWKSKSSGVLDRVVGLLDGMSTFRPSANQALRNIQSVLKGRGSRHVAAAQVASSTSTLMIPPIFPASVDSPHTSHTNQHINDGAAATEMWRSNALDTMLFSSEQIYDARDFESDPTCGLAPTSGQNYLTTAALLQSSWFSGLR